MNFGGFSGQDLVPEFSLWTCSFAGVSLASIPQTNFLTKGRRSNEIHTHPIFNRCFNLSGQAQKAPAYTDFQEAVTTAEQQGKNLALYFYTDARQTPQRLDDLLPEDWAVQTYLDRHHPPCQHRRRERCRSSTGRPVRSPGRLTNAGADHSGRYTQRQPVNPRHRSRHLRHVFSTNRVAFC